jgi:SAM-dependent methyltransferase
MDINKKALHDFFERTASSREKWKKRNRFYHRSLEKYFSFIIPKKSRVLEIGCGLGDLLHAVDPEYGVGIDFSQAILDQARKKYPGFVFHHADAEDFILNETFDYIILSDLVGSLWDVQKVFRNLKKFCHPRTRLVISNYNFFWEPMLVFGERIHLKLSQPKQNWLSGTDLDNLLQLEGFQIVTVQEKLLLPKYIPLVNFLFNRIFANLPLIKSFDLVKLIIARPLSESDQEHSVSIIIPARNERGNIENAITRTNAFGSSREFIFVEGHSGDQTYEEMLRVQEAYPDVNIKVMKQSGKGKGNAVREGFDAASGDILMILDADLTTPPESLELFYRALQQNKGEFINGCRLVYPMEKEAMRFLNLLANKFFALLFTYLLGQRLKDTLCGTKVLFARDYQAIKKNRTYFGDFDPFGDFDLLFGAAKLNLKFVEIPVRYKQRDYGSTQISRFKHGLLLIKMCLFAARKIKFI